MGHPDGVSRTRLQRLARYGHFYLPFKPRGHWRESSCVYCGNLSETVDHIPPLAWIDALGPSYFKDLGLLIVKVPACRECNLALANRKLLTITERTAYLKDYYSKKYRRVSDVKLWTKEQIDELRGRLKQAVEKFAVYQLGTDRRIQILEENLVMRSLPEEV